MQLEIISSTFLKGLSCRTYNSCVFYIISANECDNRVL